MFILAFSIKPKSRHNTNIHWWVNIQMWYIHAVEYYLAMKKEWSTNWCSNIDEPWKHYAKWKHASHKRQHIIWFPLYKMSRIGKSIETENRLVIAKGWVGGNY